MFVAAAVGATVPGEVLLLLLVLPAVGDTVPVGAEVLDEPLVGATVLFPPPEGPASPWALAVQLYDTGLGLPVPL